MLRTRVRLIAIGGVARGIILPKIYWSSLDLEPGSIFQIEFGNDGSALLVPLKNNLKGVGVDHSTETPAAPSSDPTPANQAKEESGT